MIISNCCCLRTGTACADFAPYFGTGTLNNQVGKLVVGNLVATGFTIGDYVIDWYLQGDSTLKFSSSNPGNMISGIKAYHPLTGLNSYYVEEGTWLPKIRYMYVDGVKYTSYPEPGSIYTPDLLDCLPSITVQNFTCVNGGTGDYAHTISYVNAVSPPKVADMTFNMDLNIDGSIKYIAFKFSGKDYADGLKIYYVSPLNGTSVLLDWWVVGAEVYPANYSRSVLPSAPRMESGIYDYIPTVADISDITYVLGDYIQFQVTPSYFNPSNTNTNWDLSFTCLTAESDVLNCDRSHTFPDLTKTIDLSLFSAIDAPSDPTCTFYPKFSLMAPMTLSSDFLKYHAGFDNWSNRYTNLAKDITLSMATKRNLCSGGTTGLTITDQLQEYFVFKKTGNVLTFTFKNLTDYESYRSAYNYALTTTIYTTLYTESDTSIHHFISWGPYNTQRACTTGDLTNCVFTDSTNIVTVTAHGLLDGYRILFNSITTTTGIDTDTVYYVRNKTENTFQLSITRTGAIIDLVNNGTGSYKRLVTGFICGDGYLGFSYTAARNSNFSFDDVNKRITVTLITVTNNVVNLSCDDEYEHAVIASNAINNYYASADAQYAVYCTSTTPLNLAYCAIYHLAVTDGFYQSRNYIPKDLVDGMCTATGWCEEYLQLYYYVSYKYRVRATITDISDKINNWRLCNFLNPLFCPTSCTMSGTTNVVTTSVEHGLSNGERITFGTINSVAGINITTVYYLIDVTPTTFKVSLTLGGTEVDITGTSGTGTYGDIVYEIVGGIVIEP